MRAPTKRVDQSESDLRAFLAGRSASDPASLSTFLADLGFAFPFLGAAGEPASLDFLDFFFFFGASSTSIASESPPPEE